MRLKTQDSWELKVKSSLRLRDVDSATMIEPLKDSYIGY